MILESILSAVGSSGEPYFTFLCLGAISSSFLLWKVFPNAAARFPLKFAPDITTSSLRFHHPFILPIVTSLSLSIFYGFNKWKMHSSWPASPLIGRQFYLAYTNPTLKLTSWHHQIIWDLSNKPVLLPRLLELSAEPLEPTLPVAEELGQMKLSFLENINRI